MPPRYAYWTILIDNQPTAFRARDQAELLPTLHQLKRTNPNAQMKWFARGKLWDTPEQAQWANRNLPRQAERRGRDWRPGGQHTDPRAKPKSPRAPHRDSRGVNKDSRGPQQDSRGAHKNPRGPHKDSRDAHKDPRGAHKDPRGPHKYPRAAGPSGPRRRPPLRPKSPPKR